MFHDREYILTPTRAKQLQTSMDELVSYWVDEKIPPCTCTGWMAQQKYNSYYPFCQMTDKEVKKYLAMISPERKIVSTKTAIYEVVDEVRKELK